MLKKLNVPFIKSRGFECGQTCAAMMIKYFKPSFKPDFDKFNHIIHHSIFHKWLGKDYKSQIKFIDLESYNWMVNEGKKKNLFEKRQTTIKDIVKLFSKGHLVSFIVDWNTLKKSEGSYEGHSLLLTGVDDDNVFIHDPDEGPYIKYSKKDIEKAYRHPAIEDDVFIAYSKK